MLNTVNQKAAHLFMHLLMRTLGHIFVHRGLRASATTFVLLMSVVLMPVSAVSQTRVTEGVIAAYDFASAEGDIVYDVSGFGSALNLSITEPEKVSWQSCGGLNINEPTRIFAEGSSEKITTAVKASEAITIEAWVVPDNTQQTGPSRIVTLSQNPYRRNFTLGQYGAEYDVRFRTTSTGGNGLHPSTRTSEQQANTELTHIIYTRNAQNMAKIYVNGVLASSQIIPGSTANWANQFHFGLANEFIGQRPWLGQYYYVGLYDRALSDAEIQQNFSVGIQGPCNRPPLVSFLRTPAVGEAPLIVSFDGSASKDLDGSISDVYWDFGDGNTTSSQTDTPLTATHSYEQPGNYSVTLRVTDNEGSHSEDTQSVQVFVPGSTQRITANQLALYNFTTGSGDIVNDVSGAGGALNLLIEDPDHTRWLQCGGLSIDQSTRLSSIGLPSKINAGVKASNEVSIEAWVVPDSSQQYGPARIVTLSKNAGQRNITLAQKGGEYVTRLRTTSTDLNGLGGRLHTNNHKAVSRLTHVMYTRSATGEARIYVDGELISTKNISGTMANWDDNAGFALANEFMHQRSWLGEYYMVAVYDRALSESEIQQNKQAGITTACNKLPEAEFELSDPIGQLPFDVDFDASRSFDFDGHILEHQWNFGDGESGQGVNVSHRYTLPGTYQVTLTVMDNDGDIAEYTQSVQAIAADVPARISVGQQALYAFLERDGSVVRDVSGVGTPLNLSIQDPDKTTWLECGGLSVDQSTLISGIGSASKISDAIKESNAITLEAWITPDNNRQNGPARIVTLSDGVQQRNVTLGQQRKKYDVRLRTTFTGDNGNHPSVRTSSRHVKTRLTHVVYTKNANGLAKIYVNGRLAKRRFIFGSTDNWNNDFAFGLANEFGANRSWLGDYRLVAVYDRALSTDEVLHNFDVGVRDACGDNFAPVIVSQPVESAELNTAYHYTVVAIDAEGDLVNYQLDSAPLGMSIDAITGQIEWTPAVAGDYSVTVRAVDILGSYSVQTFSIQVGAIDTDGDGVPDDQDAFPNDPNESSDLDGDGIGDNSDPDRDGDGYFNDDDAFPNDPDEWSDLDGDGIGDNEDPDRDDDGVNDDEDAFPDDPNESADLDGDGIGDNADLDRDGDGVNNDEDAFPNDPNESADLDGDGIGDNADTDRDGDGVDNDTDVFPDDPEESSDLDNDGIGDNADTDRDGDGVDNNDDVFPDDPNESADLDGDGIGDNADPDRDGDGVINDQDAFPNDASETSDLDGDGIGDNTDLDRDGDGVPNIIDVFPNNPFEHADLDGDGIGDNSDDDRDGDGINNDYEIQAGTNPNDAADVPADYDNDGIPDVLDDDADNDGVLNDQDAFPLDADRSTLPAVSQVISVLNAAAESVIVSWQAPSDMTAVAEYRIYRRQWDGPFSELDTAPLTTTQLVDSSVVNGQLYEYRVVAITDTGLDGEEAPLASVMVAFNNHALQNLLLDRQPNVAQLQWQSISAANARYRLYRASAIGNAAVSHFEPLSEVGDTNYSDNGLRADTSYHYRVASLLDWVNPQTNEALVIEGPLSDTVIGEALPTLAIVLFDVNVAADGVFEKIQTTTNDITLSGEYINAVGAVSIVAESNGQTVSASSNDGSFRLVLPYTASGAVWNIVVTELTVTDRSFAVAARIILDSSIPEVIISNTAPFTTLSDSYVLQGSVTDNGGDIQRLYAQSSRFAEATFEVSTTSNHGFVSHVPLLFGENILRIIAEDGANNRAEASLTVERTVALAPSLTLDSPLSGTTVNTSSISISGRLYTALAPENIRVRLGEQIVYPEASGTPGLYHYVFNQVRLNVGYNNFVVTAETTAGNVSAFTTVQYLEQPSTAIPQPPVITITHPAVSRDTRANSLTIAGNIVVLNPPVTLSINGHPVSVVEDYTSNGASQPTTVLFQDSIALNTEGKHDITLIATDSEGLSTTQTLSIIRDTQLPLIHLEDASLAFAPVVNNTVETPFVLAGTVVDAHLAGLTINGNRVDLLPQSDTTTFSFNAALALPANVEQSVLISAVDYAGNTTEQTLIIHSAPSMTIEVISPIADAELGLSASNANIDVVARIEGLTEGATVQASVDDGAAVAMTADGDIYQALIALDLTVAQHRLRLEVIDSNAELLASTTVDFSSVNIDAIPLSIQRIEPTNNAEAIEPNASINVYFNKPIDPALVQINVRETVSGMTYDTRRPAPTDFPDITNATPMEVVRNQEPVPGEVGVLPENTVAAFFAERDLAYGADVYIDVIYDGATLGRYRYQVRDIPSFVQGLVTDQLGEAVAGLRVSLPTLGLTTTTDENGSYSFGFGLSAANALPEGRHSIVYNPSREAAAYGEISYWVDIQKGHLNRLGVFKVPLLSDSVPFQQLRSGQGSVLLANGELTLDLSETQLRFPDANSVGNVHVQFMPVEHLSFSSLKSSTPQWLFQLQPAGIQVRGNVGIRIDMPKLHGSYSYVPPDGTLVLMIGLDPISRQHIPVGVGEVQNRQVLATVEALQRLDYIGYAIIDYAAQPLLQAYVDANLEQSGSASLQEVIQLLENAY